MRDDLLDAQACIDWSVAQLKVLEVKFGTWCDTNLKVRVKDADHEAADKPVVIFQDALLPAAFHVEIGCIVNTLRSSLDLLATSLAQRYGMANPSKAYFPFANDAAEFCSGKFRGFKFIQALPKPEQAIIKLLKPYEGGNSTLWDLHQLDIMRKHRRLLTVTSHAGTFSISGWGVAGKFKAADAAWIAVSDQEALIGHLAASVTDYKMKVTGYIAIDEIVLAGRKPAIAALREFASSAESIINLFDDA